MLQTTSQGKSLTFIGVTWIAFSAPMLLSFAGGRLADRHSRFALMITGFTIQGLAWFVFSFTELSWVYVAALVVGGLAFAFAFPAKQALLVQISPARWLGSIQGVEQASMQGAAFIGTLVAPLVYGAIGGWVFALCGGVALTGVAVATPILSRHWACIRDGARHCAEADDGTETVPPPGAAQGAPPKPGVQEAPAEADAG
jgi:MFS family permease